MVSSDYQSFGNYAYGGSPRTNPSLLSSNDAYVTKPPITIQSQPNAAGAVSSASAVSSKSESAPSENSDKGGIGGFFKGILNGAKGLVDFITQPKNWPLIIGALAVCSFFPMVGVGLAAIGLLMGGIQVGKGLSSGDMEQVGSGVFDMGLWAAGGVSSWKAAQSAKSAAAGAEVAQAASSGSRAGALAKNAPTYAWNTVSSGSTAQSLTNWTRTA